MLGALPIRILYKKIVILHIIKKIISSHIHKLNFNDIRENRMY
jgi:hypothetical protein